VSVIQTVREYELHELLGGGGMGEVYRARHVLLDQPYAVKVVLPALLQNAEIRARFLREAQTLQRLDHPNILRFVTLFEDSGRLFLVTELLAGQPLDLHFYRIASAAPTGWGTPGPEAAARVDFFHQTVRGVAHAHRRGILHRDLKPGNLHVLPDGRLKILDFGIARPIAARALTATGHLVGTPVYLPPEIILGEMASSAAGPTWDVYTLGLLAYEMFTGHLPFDLDANAPPLQLLNDLSRFYARRSRGPDFKDKVPGLSKAWSDAIERALAPDAARRPADAGALLRLLDAAPALTDTTAQTVPQSTENLAPEDATAIHNLRRPPVPLPSELGGSTDPGSVHSLLEETQVVRVDADLLSPRMGAPVGSAAVKASPTTRARLRTSAWVGPAVGASNGRARRHRGRGPRVDVERGGGLIRGTVDDSPGAAERPRDALGRGAGARRRGARLRAGRRGIAAAAFGLAAPRSRPRSHPARCVGAGLGECWHGGNPRRPGGRGRAHRARLPGGHIHQ